METPLRSPPATEHVGGNNPWSLEGDSTVVTYVKNVGTEASSFVASVFHPDGQYVIGLRSIAAGETFAIDVRKLRDERIPDVYGKTLPLDLLSGQTHWYWHDGAQLIGRTNVMSAGLAIANNMSCPSCQCMVTSVSTSVSPGTATLAAGDSVTPTVYETDLACDNSETTYPISASYLNWISDDTTIASTNGSAITAVDAGQTTVHGTQIFSTETFIEEGILPDEGPIGRCEQNSMEAGADVTVAVKVPASLSVSSYELSANQCTSSQFGAKAKIRYQVLDQDGNPFKKSGMVPQEKITNFFINGVHQVDPASDWATLGAPSDTLGKFNDDPLGGCASFAIVETASQQISVLIGTKRYPSSGALRTNSLYFEGLSAGHGRVCNPTGSNCSGADFVVIR